MTAADKYCSFLETVEPTAEGCEAFRQALDDTPSRSGGEEKEPKTQWENGELAAEEIKAAEK